MISIGALLLTMFVVIPHALKYRRMERIRIVDALAHPVAVTGWSEQGLELVDVRLIQLPGVLKLPPLSTALKEATSRGVEIDEQGRVYGLVRIHHWCGNDPVGEHIARVDLAELVAFFSEGAPVEEELRRFHFAAEASSRSFTVHGWNGAGYDAFLRVKR